MRGGGGLIEDLPYLMLVPVVQMSDSTIHLINQEPVDKCQGNQLSYPVDRDLSTGKCFPPFEQLATDCQRYFFGIILPQLKNLILLSQTESTKS